MVTKCTCNSGDIKLFFEVINSVSDECRLHIRNDGLYAKVIDAGNCEVADARLLLPLTRENEPEDREVGINVKRMIEVLNIIDGLEISITITETEVKIVNRGYVVGVKLLSPETIRKDPNTPALQLAVEATENTGKSIPTIIKKIGELCGKVEISSTKDSLGIKSANTDDPDNVDKILGADEVTFAKNPGTPVASIYDWILLKKVIKVLESKLPPAVYRFGINYPLVIESHNERITARFMIAPRLPPDTPTTPAPAATA